MKIILYVLAAIGLGVMLLIGGCFGLAFFTIAYGPETPDYATKEYFQNNYGDDIRHVTQYIAGQNAEREGDGQGLSLQDQLSEDIVAVIEIHEADDVYDDDEYRDILKKHQVRKGSYHSLMSRIGVANSA